MPNPLRATLDFLTGVDTKARGPEAPPAPAAEAKQYVEPPAFWPGMPPVGPGMWQRFLPDSPAQWVPAPSGAAGWDGNVTNSAAFACLNVIATAFHEPPLRVYRRLPDGSVDALPDHPLQPLLDRPNPYHAAPELWYWTQWALHTHGNAYWRKVRAGDPLTGNVVELWPLSPTRVIPVTLEEDRLRGVFISYYRYDAMLGQPEQIDPTNLVHFRLGLDDFDMRLGCSPLRRLFEEVLSDDEATAFTAALLANFAVPGLVVTTQDRTLTREDAERIKDDVGSRFGNGNRGRVGVLNNGATVAQFGFSPEQLDLRLLHRLPEERISAALGVPAIVAGLGAGLDRATYSNAQEARQIFTEQKLCPLWVSTAGSIDLQLLGDFDGDPATFTRFELTDVRALQEDEDKKYARLNLGVQNKWITVNEARADVGLPPVDGGDDFGSPNPIPPELLAGAANPPALPPPQNQNRQQQPGQAGEVGNAGEAGQQAFSGGETKAQALRAMPAMMDVLQALARPGMQRALEAYFSQQHARVVDAVLKEG